MSKPKACPCCGGTPEKRSFRFNKPNGKMDYTGKSIECACGLWTKYCRTIGKAIAIWNRRAKEIV